MPYQNNHNQYGRGQQTRQQNNSPLTKDFYNPYAFVPLSDRVFILDEDEVNCLKTIQDIPVEGGLSGKIKIDFLSETPFCVRESNQTNDSFKVSSQYMIPGTSLKGMIRSVLEILSMSNIRNGIDNSRYSMRDLSSPDYKLKNQEQKSGFLILLNGKYYIQECQSEQVSYRDIEKEERVHDLKGKKINDMYRTIKDRVVFYKDGPATMWFFSGPMQNKKHEYQFDIPVFSEDKMIPLEEKEHEEFRFIHEVENENAAWKFWKKQLKNYASLSMIEKDGYHGIVPCFFRTKPNGNSVQDLGFSYLYRQPYPHTIHDFLPKECRVEGIDMAQAIFGYTGKTESLRGRVQFHHVFIGDAQVAEKRSYILGSPKPTYYPFYIEQSQTGELQTYFSERSIISGYKRYIHRGKVEQSTEITDRNRKVITTFAPLCAGTRFETEVSFFNLRPYELGALLAAIDFCGHSECCHSLGFAKPFGYGRMKVENCEAFTVEGNKIERQPMVDAFVKRVCDGCGYSREEWENQVKQLFFIASGQYYNKVIRYPLLRNNEGNNEFVRIKNAKQSLKDFTPHK